MFSPPLYVLIAGCVFIKKFFLKNEVMYIAILVAAVKVC